MFDLVALLQACFGPGAGALPEQKGHVPSAYIKEKLKKRNSPYDDWRRHPVVKQYVLVAAIGHGAFSEIWLARHAKTGVQVALKVVDLFQDDVNDTSLEALEAEAKFLQLLDCPHVLRCHAAVETRHHVVMVLDFLSGGELLDHCHSLPPEQYNEQYVAQLFAQVVSGVAYMHSLNILHRDLKPGNVMLERPASECAAQGKGVRLKIIDLGLAGVYDPNDPIMGAIGTPGYIAPEICRSDAPHTPSMDIYSLGVMLFVMLVGRKPFWVQDVKTLYYMHKPIKSAPGLQDPKFLSLSAPVRELLLSMLDDDPAKRPTAQQVLKHPWFTMQAGEGGVQDVQGQMGDAVRARLRQLARLQNVVGLRYALNVRQRKEGQTQDDYRQLLQQRSQRVAELAHQRRGCPLPCEVDDDEQHLDALLMDSGAPGRAAHTPAQDSSCKPASSAPLSHAPAALRRASVGNAGSRGGAAADTPVMAHVGTGHDSARCAKADPLAVLNHLPQLHRSCTAPALALDAHTSPHAGSVTAAPAAGDGGTAAAPAPDAPGDGKGDGDGAHANPALLFKAFSANQMTMDLLLHQGSLRRLVDAAGIALESDGADGAMAAV